MRSWNVTMRRLAIWALLFPALSGVARAQDNDLEMDPAPNITAAANGANWHSPDIKLGADFGDASVPDTVRRGADTPIFAKFEINGIQDFTITNGIRIFFHYRNAAIGETPPAITDASWNAIGTLAVPHNPAEPFFLTQEWPTDFPSVVTKSVSWVPPIAGNLFHVRAHVVYPGETPTTASPTDDDPGDNVAISLYESILGVRDVDLVIVHDVSGSMITNTFAGDTYLAHAKSRASNFIWMMSESHKLGVVAFGGCLAGGREDIWTVPATPLSPANFGNKAAAIVAIAANVTVPNAGCLTPLGVGVERAIQILTAEAASPDRKRTILLLSDGWENSGTPRACNGADPASPCLGTGILSQLQANDIRLYSIALGAAAGTECLECLASNTSGSWYAPAGPGLDLGEVYLHMQQAYSADDLYRIDRGTSGGGDDAYRTFFEGADNLLYFNLQTDRLDAELDLEIRPPGGAWTAAGSLAGASVHRDRGYLVVRVTNPAVGEWGYRVVGEPRQDYLVAVRSDRVATRLRLDLRSKGIVGSALGIRARLERLGEPIDNARLVAKVQFPARVSFETLLRKFARELILQTGRLPLDPEWREKSKDLTPRELFLKSLGDRRRELDELAKTRTVEIALEQTGPGVYSGVLEQVTQIAGEYKVSVEYSTEKADRTWSESVRLRPGRLDPDRSSGELVVVKDASGKATWLLRVYPADTFGNALVSQAAVAGLEAVIDGAKPEGKPVVAFDSAVEQQLKVDGRRRPVLKRLTIGGKEIPIRYTEDGANDPKR